MKNLQLCPKCIHPYTIENPPKQLINCPHLICLQCLQEEIICPLQSCRKRIQKRKYHIDSFLTHEETLFNIINPTITLSNTSSKTFIAQRQSSPLGTDQLQSGQPSLISAFLDSEKQQKEVDIKKEDKQEQFQFETCLLHSKVADLICLQHQCLICSNCGLFGQHKQHKLLPYDQFLSQFTLITEESFKIYQNLKEKEELFKQERLKGQVDNLLQNKREKELKGIKSHVIALNSIIKRYESQLIANLETMISFKREKMLQGLRLEDALSKKNDFMASIEKMSEGIECILRIQNFEEYLKYLDKDSPQGYIIKEGEYLLVEIDNLHKHLQHHINTQAQEFSFQFNIQQDLIKNMITLHSKDIKEVQHLIHQSQQTKPNIKTNRKPHMPTPHLPPHERPSQKSPVGKSNNEDLLLIGTNSKSGSQTSNGKENYSPAITIMQPNHIDICRFDSTPSLNESNSHIQNQHNISAARYSNHLNPINYNLSHSTKQKHAHTLTDSHLYSSINKKQCKSRSKHDLSSGQNSERQNMPTEKSQHKRRRRLDLKDKYLKIYEQLQKDRLEVVDLGGGFLGDSNILYISELFPSKNKLKTAKLMNNKITDEAFPQLIHNCRHLSSLNLSYNSLTEKSLEWLQRQVQNLGQLKNVTLSNNKIVLRNVRDRLQNLSRQKLNVSL